MTSENSPTQQSAPDPESLTEKPLAESQNKEEEPKKKEDIFSDFLKGLERGF